MIDSEQELAERLEEARRLGCTAIDVEMVWERTFYPALGVIQLGFSRQQCHLVDAVALEGRLAPLAELLSGPTVKVLHDALQDLTVLRMATGASPRSIFDTRIAAGFAGLAHTISLRDLLQELFGVELEKTETRTDWLRRPLSPTQIGYAEDDVRYLVEAREELLRRARAAGVEDWLQEEMAGLDDPALYEERDPREAFRRVKGYGKLDRRQLAVLRELAVWRETAARELDRPRGQVASDKLLLLLAQRQPVEMEDLREIRSLRRHLRTRGEALLRAVRAGLDLEPGDWPSGPPRIRHGREVEMRSRAASERVRERASARGIDEGLVATRGEVRSLVREGPEKEAGCNRLAGGWRWTLVGEEVAAEFHRP
ncbi:MAG: HRDC domain-containing protein [Gemmatimonadaceae bacterium]|nr:HRDC domain-containing protein [Gemmatimonadaceae bacterium]